MIVWRDSMSVGLAAIDDDHRHLINLVNEFEVCRDWRQAETVVKRMFHYTQGHFAKEEALHEAIGYPLATAHKLEHDEIAARLKG